MQERILWIDTLKGILLLLICIGHIPDIPCGISWVLAPTSMYYVPAFFILSGYLLNVKRPPKDFLQNKIKHLLGPYFMLGLIFIALDWNTFLNFPESLLHNLNRFLIEGSGPVKAAPLWFVMALFGGTLLGYSVLRLVSYPLFLILVTILLAFVSLVLSKYQIHFLGTAQLWPSTAVFIIAGYFSKKVIIYLNSQKLIIRYLIASLCIIIGGFGMYKPLGDFHFNIISSFPLFFISPIILCLGICILLELYSPSISLFNYIARNGLVILASHAYFIIIASTILTHIPFFETYKYLTFLTMFMAILLIEYLFVIPLFNAYLYKLLGKEKNKAI